LSLGLSAFYFSLGVYVMILLQAMDVARLFGPEVLFQHINLSVSDNARVALVGRNGAGKSTLLKILAGVEQPDEGNISKKKNLDVGYLAQNTGLDSDETVYNEMLKSFSDLRQMEQRLHALEEKISVPQENLDALLKEYEQLQHDFLDRNGYGYENEIRSVLHGFSFGEEFYEQKISDLSGGQKTRLALAKILLEAPELLILDEPTNHLDIETLSWLEGYLKNYKGSILIVSHDRYFLDKVVTETYELSRHKLTYFKGNYSRYLDLKAEMLQSEWKQYEKQQTEIHKLEDFVNRNLVRASTTKRAQSRRKQLEKMERLDKPQGDEKSVKFGFQIDKISGNVVLTVDDAAIGYSSEEVLADPVNLDVRRRDAIALVGPNGIGKSTLLKSIIGRIPFIRGEAVLGANVSIGYYDQGQADLHGNKTVLDELWDEHKTTPEKDIRNVLGGFLFTGDDVEKTIPLLSGGEKARVALAKLSMNKENFLILDEPTNHLDIDNKEVLENALIDYEGTLLFVSHDRYFINRIATKVIELSPEGSKLYLGDYDYYLEKKAEEEAIAAQLEEENKKDTVIETTAKNDFFLNKEQQRERRKLQRNLESIEKETAEKEDRLQEIEQEMAIASDENDVGKLNRLNEEMMGLNDNLERLLNDWEEATIALEEFDSAD
jgi:ATP-binding cassette subfamily F protein 3